MFAFKRKKGLGIKHKCEKSRVEKAKDIPNVNILDLRVMPPESRLSLVRNQMCKLAADLKINGRWNESHKAVNIYINQVTHPVFIPGILSLFSHILCHLIHKHGLQFHEMHRALMHLQYKHSPPSVEQFEQVHRAMRFTEQQCPRRGGGRGLSGGSPLQLPPRILGMCIPCDIERHQPRENNHLV